MASTNGKNQNAHMGNWGLEEILALVNRRRILSLGPIRSGPLFHAHWAIAIEIHRKQMGVHNSAVNFNDADFLQFGYALINAFHRELKFIPLRGKPRPSGRGGIAR
jgi:hypothetical protein